MERASASIGQQAQDWFARLRAPDCGPAEHAAFERWRAADARHASAYANLDDIWELTAELATADTAIAAAAHQARSQVPPGGFHRYRWPLLASAAVLVLALGLGSRLNLSQDAAPIQRYATAVGEQRTLTLEDGSRVVLDTATVLQVRYGRRHRSLTLEQGRADFQVYRDANRPFTVQAGPGRVTATGTRFQVRWLDGAGLVTLLEGQVRVAAKATSAEAPLTPGERIAIAPSGALGTPQRLGEADLANAQGWIEGQLVVKEWPLEALVTEVNRYGRTPVRLGDASLRDLPVSGTFSPTEPESLALALEYGWPVRVEQGDGEIVLHRR